SGKLKSRLKSVFEHIDSECFSDWDGWLKALYLWGREAVGDVLLLRAARAGLSPEAWAEDQAQVAAMAVPVFLLRASDVMEAGLKAGPELGQALKRIEALWLDNGFSQNVITEAVDDIRKRTNIEGQFN